MATAAPKFYLFAKAGLVDSSVIGSCPFTHQLIMILLLKSVDIKIKLITSKHYHSTLQKYCPGEHFPFLYCKGTTYTDISNIEQLLEDTLPPKLEPIHPSSYSVGLNIYSTFSRFIKTSKSAEEPHLKRLLFNELKKLDKYLREPLPSETTPVSRRKFLDGDNLTLADCRLLPKLNTVKVVCSKYKGFNITDDFPGICRYLTNAESVVVFRFSAPTDVEIETCYLSIVGSC